MDLSFFRNSTGGRNSVFGFPFLCPKLLFGVAEIESLTVRNSFMMISLTLILHFCFLEICCPVPDAKNVRVIEHKRMYPENGCTYFHDDTVLYKCHDNKTSSATCSSDGTWHPKTPSCGKSKNEQNYVLWGRVSFFFNF